MNKALENIRELGMWETADSTDFKAMIVIVEKNETLNLPRQKLIELLIKTKASIREEMAAETGWGVPNDGVPPTPQAPIPQAPTPRATTPRREDHEGKASSSASAAAETQEEMQSLRRQMEDMKRLMEDMQRKEAEKKEAVAKAKAQRRRQPPGRCMP